MTSQDAPPEGAPNVPLRTIVLAVLVVLGLLIVAVMLFGDPNAGEPEIVIKIQPHPRGPTEIVQQTAPATPSSAALVAENGIVITDPALTEETPDGAMPKIGPDGRRPLEVYARAFDRTDPRPRIAIIVSGLGIGEAVTQAAVDKLPGTVTLAFTPYGNALQSWVSAARADGHEVMLELPMEPFDYPDNDPGPNTLMTGSAAGENTARLQWLMTRFTGYVGVMNAQGGKFLATADDLRPLVEQVKRRGLLFIDSGQADRSVAREVASSAEAPFSKGDQLVDRVPTREGIEAELTNLETIAKTRGTAVGIATAYPVTIDRLASWAATLEEKGIALVSITALVAAQSAAPPPAPRFDASTPTIEAPPSEDTPPAPGAPGPSPTPAAPPAPPQPAPAASEPAHPPATPPAH